MDNLLYNGGFEDEFHPWRGTGELHTADGWTPWWVPQSVSDPAWKNRRPEFKRATLAVDPGRVRNGESAQQYFSFWGTHIGGVWQQAVVTTGALLRLQAWGHAWSSEADHPRPSENPTNVHMSIGIDPYGGTDPVSSSVIWSEDHSAIDEWYLFAVSAQAFADIVTVFIRSAPEWPKKHQDIYWDDVSLEVVEPSQDAPPVAGGDPSTRVEIDPALPQPGDEVTACVLSPSGHVHVSLILWRPNAEAELAGDPTVGRQGGDHVWQYALGPAESGEHTLVFGSDRGSRVISWLQVSVGAEEPTMPPNGDGPPEQPGAGEQPEERQRGAPREQYARTYVLLPPTADAEWAEAAMRGSYDARRTVGFSADDAGIGNLESRRVIAVNPHHWAIELTSDWFETHYPGVGFFPLAVDSPDDLARALRNWRD